MTVDTATRAGAAFEIGLEANHGWTRYQEGPVSLWAKGHLNGETFEQLAHRIATTDMHDHGAIDDLLGSLDGNWALAATSASWAFAAVDRVRSIPLIWAQDDGRVLVDQDGPRLARRLGPNLGQVDPVAALSVALSGFTIGDDTLYPDVRQIGPGGFVLKKTTEAPVTGRYHKWTPWLPDNVAYDDLVVPLKSLHEQLIDRLIESADGQRILIPLSAGLDSRFIAAGLRAAGYENVVCFAYGISDNREAVVSRRIAQRLGYSWHFIPFDPATMRAVFATDDHAAFRAGADSLTGIHFPQDYLALNQLIQRGVADHSSVVVNGQSGDFITGNHIPASLTATGRDESEAVRRDAIVDALLAKHFRQWAFLRTPAVLARLAERLRHEIDAVGMPNNTDGDHGIYEFCEFQDRQAKYVIGGQRAYEHFGLDWRLPLWDQNYLDFWARAPLTAKAGQSLYRHVLREQNWGGVWGDDIPVNPTRIRPLWLLPLRFGAKVLHAPLGRARWHAFERRYFDYWMNPICPYGSHTWAEVARDRRGHWSGIAWHIEDYLSEKGVSLDGLLA